MSRRKQSNPKPIKRLSDGEKGEDDMEDKIRNEAEVDDKELIDQSDSSEESSDQFKSEDIKPDVTNIKSEVTENEEENEVFPGSTDGEVPDYSEKALNFPNDILLFKKLDDAESEQSGREFIVCTAIPLPKSSGLGPFRGELVSLSTIKQGDVVLQAQAENGETRFVKVLDETGTWLSQLRPSPSESTKNCSVHFQGGKIWCDIVSNVEAQSELMASFTIGNESENDENTSVKVSDDVMDHEEMKLQIDIKEEITDEPPAETIKETTTVTSPTKHQNNHAALLYGCPFCGVRFSSARTLEGHLTYYCSKKPIDFMPTSIVHDTRKTNETTEETDAEMKATSASVDNEEKGHRTEKSDSSSEAASSELGGGSPVSKSIKTGEIYKCPFCSYTADKSSSLNRHKRIHNRGSNPEEIMKYSLSVPKNETYCKDCNIQFSSLSTYKCHREYYCSKRRFSVDSAAATSGSDSSPSPQNLNTSPVGLQENSTIFSEGITSLKPDDLKKVISVSSGSMLSSQTRVLLAPPILAPNGVGDMTMGMPTVIVQPIVAAASAIAAHQNAIKHNPKKISSQAEQPLDLSTSRKDEKSESNEYRPESSGSEQCMTESVKIKEECITPQTSPKIKSPPSTPASDVSSPTKSSASTPGAKSLPEMPPLMTVHQLPYICGKPIPPMLQSVSKCSECNIVFYKRENYLIHKKHYCSSRRGKMESPDNYDTESSNDSFPLVNSSSVTKEDLATRQIVSPRKLPNEPEKESVVSPPVPALKSPKIESKVPEEVFYKYYCVPCKIKFSSSSTLKAHKEFYCPHGKESGKTIIAKKTLEEISNSPKTADDELFKCDRCESEFVSGRLLKLHFCTGVSSATPLLRCPYCEFVTQVESRISEHMKVHMPNKVYRCTLCRYRGNTVRGMRMHGKMHLDNGEDFTDENMIEIEEPPLIPVKLNNNGDNRPVDIETELLRLKNEPYKRRRSRKSFEKSEHASSVTNVCMFCGQKFRDLSSFALHLKIHEMIALQAAVARNIKCQYCDTVAENFDELLQHIQVQHQDKIMMEQRSPSSQGQSSRSNSRSSVSNSRPGSVEQSEVNDIMSQKETLSPPVKKIKREQSERSTPNGETNTSSKTESASASVKQEPLDCSSYQQAMKDDNPEHHKEIKRDEQSNLVLKERRSSTSSSETDLNSANIQQSSSPRVSDSGDDETKISKTVKTETTMNGNLNHSPPINVPVFDPQQLIPYYHLLPGMSGLSHLVSVSVQNSISPSRSEKPTAKYCTHCDIKFTYQSSYLAHKKYYCSSRTPSEGQATSPVS